MAEDNKQPAAAAGEQQARPQGGQLGIQKIYVKDMSFEAPNTPDIFTQEWKPRVDIQMASNSTNLSEDVHEVVLSVTCTVKFDDTTVYLAEVHQAGIFNISGVPKEYLPAMMATVCPNILFPFARESVADMVTRGGFPQLLLAPVNFEAIYAQELQRQRAESQEQPGS